jgi:predicted enzyme related to lactoylglutathione lyase
MPRVVHFDLPAEDPLKLKGFYEKVFGWKFEKWDDPSGRMEYWMIITGKDEPGIDGGMGRKRGPEDQVANTIGVPDVDEYVKKIMKEGGKIIMPKMAIPGVGWIASFLDPQGNKHMIMQDDESAK